MLKKWIYGILEEINKSYLACKKFKREYNTDGLHITHLCSTSKLSMEFDEKV